MVGFLSRGARFGATVLVCFALLGCAQSGVDQSGQPVAGMGQKQAVGTGLGALIGGVAGAFIGKGAGKAVAIVAGAAIGGLIGNQIGAALDAEDQKAIQEKAAQALLTEPDNAKIQWKSNHSGASATIVPTDTRVVKRKIALLRAADVAPPVNMEFTGKWYRVVRDTNVRLGPSTADRIATTLAAGSSIWGVGQVRGHSWMMVSQHGKAIGYVVATNVASPQAWRQLLAARRNRRKSLARRKSAASPQVATRSAPAAKPFNLDAAMPVRSPADLDALAKAPGSGVKLETVTASVTCRDITMDTTIKNQSRTSTETACKSPDGSWDIE